MTNNYYKLGRVYFKLHAYDIRREFVMRLYLDEINGKTKEELREMARLEVIKEYPALLILLQAYG